MKELRVTVWNEFRHEKKSEVVKGLYPDGIHEYIKSFLEGEEIVVRTATLDEENHGLDDTVLDNTDVLIWWGHKAHGAVSDEIVEKIHDRVLRGMGFIGLHSAHHSKIFKKLMGTTCNLRWRHGDRERVWCCMPGHPIAQGIDPWFDIDTEEMYGEYFDIPQPDELIFLGWFKGGEAVRAGCTFHRGLGKIFYFQPGHESNPTFHNSSVQTIIKNAVRWAKPCNTIEKLACVHPDPLEV